ncbi:helix-turn-helix domain-containing protein [Flavobacterium phragmitis]|uniref:HTH cro/C1-type domain-containing protein n=1 Tax=Flavobacterium phragmitis TaxID=739143 RepID=A0A1I1NU51_9FLAO|nr:helix-turn-helix transcriptional regulator [Flavobacterium phragmitis]SFD01077.1 hypothetical protein SAMN05216297_103453 [Flavobacterium phragmitis]
MKAHLDIEKLISDDLISNELDYERALVAERKLRLLSKESVHFKNLRIKLRRVIEKYENQEWSDVNNFDTDKLIEIDKYEEIAELERVFIENRKYSIREKLKDLDLTQGDLAVILGHKSKTHMSELINGIKPFTLKDLVIINRVLKIEIGLLIPVFLSKDDQLRLNEIVKVLDKPKVKLNLKDLIVS